MIEEVNKQERFQYLGDFLIAHTIECCSTNYPSSHIHSIIPLIIILVTFGNFIFQALLLIPTIYILISCFLLACQQGCKFFRCLGNWLELTSMLLCLASISMYVVCVVMATEAAKRFHSSPSSFTGFEKEIHLHEILRSLHAWLLFLLFLKVIQESASDIHHLIAKQMFVY